MSDSIDELDELINIFKSDLSDDAVLDEFLSSPSVRNTENVSEDFDLFEDLEPEKIKSVTPEVKKVAPSEPVKAEPVKEGSSKTDSSVKTHETADESKKPKTVAQPVVVKADEKTDAAAAEQEVVAPISDAESA